MSNPTSNNTTNSDPIANLIAFRTQRSANAPVTGATLDMYQPIGSIFWSSEPGFFTGNEFVVPADGRAISRAAYPELFALYLNGALWGGGDGTTTFNVPDMRGRVPMGEVTNGVNGHVTGKSVGNTGGTENVTLTAAQLPVHDHGLNAVAGASLNGAGDTAAIQKNGAGGTFAQTQDAGSGQGHPNLQPYAVGRWMVRIK